jgi:hypothetical protein
MVDLGLIAGHIKLLNGFQLNLELGGMLCELLDDLAEVRKGPTQALLYLHTKA